MNKIELRKYYLALRKGKPRSELSLAGEKICERLLRLPQMQAAKTVMVYLSFGAEVDTHALIRALLARGKRVCAPLCAPETYTMTAYYFDDLNTLNSGAYGILEPRPEMPCAPEHIDAVLVPGCVFGRNFHRIGYGKGYYDRYLKNVPQAAKIGLCYDFCLTEQVEAEETDTPVDVIVTEKEVVL